MQDSTPLLLLVGQVARETIGREAFQELDYRAVFGSMAKWVTQIDRAERVPELIARAFAVATSGRPGPGRRRAARGHARVGGRRARRRAAPRRSRGARRAEASIARLGELLAQARAPLAIVGEGGWTAQTGADVAAFAEAQAHPGRRLVPLPGLRRQRLARVRGPRRAGDGPGAGQAHPRGRRAAGDRRAPGRDPDRRLHARAPRRADPAPGPRAPRPRRDRRRVPDRAGDRRRPRGLRGRRARAGAGGRRRRAPGCWRRRAASTSATWPRRASCPGRCRCRR